MQYASPFGDRSDLIMVASGANSTNSSVLACRTRSDTGIDLLQSMFGYTNTFSCKKLAGHGYKSVQKENLALAYWNIEAYEIEYRPKQLALWPETGPGMARGVCSARSSSFWPGAAGARFEFADVRNPNPRTDSTNLP